MDEYLILVDENDREVGSAEKIDAHRRGVLHRAFSVFLFHPDGRVLMQRRALGKYHSPGVWSNTACGHPRPGEATSSAAERRLFEEFGIRASLEEAFVFTYRAPLGELIEHEVDHVFTAVLEAVPNPDPAEILEWAWVEFNLLVADVGANPAKYSVWLPTALAKLRSVKAENFLAAIHGDQRDEARRLFAELPAISSASLLSAAAAGDAGSLRAFIETVRGQPTVLNEALVHVCRSYVIEPHGANGVECAQLLLDAGASANASVPFETSSTALPALFFCCWTNKPLVARLLLERGANTQDGESIYHAAEHNHRECLEVLKEFNADFSDAQSQFGNTPLFFLAGYREHDSICASSELGMRWLLENGADPDVPSYVGKEFPEAGSVPLHRLAANGRNVGIIAAFLDHGASVDARRGDDRTPSALAMRAGNTPAAELLASRGANTALMEESDKFVAACIRNDRSAAEEILARKPTLMSKPSQADSGAFLNAVTTNCIDGVRLMLDFGFDINAVPGSDGTPLHWAAWHGRPRLVELLLERGAGVNERDTSYGSSPIAWASHGSTYGRPGGDEAYVEIVNLLLDAGSEREAAINKWGEPPGRMSSAAVAAALRERGFAAK